MLYVFWQFILLKECWLAREGIIACVFHSVSNSIEKLVGSARELDSRLGLTRLVKSCQEFGLTRQEICASTTLTAAQWTLSSSKLSLFKLHKDLHVQISELRKMSLDRAGARFGHGWKTNFFQGQLGRKWRFSAAIFIGLDKILLQFLTCKHKNMV